MSNSILSKVCPYCTAELKDGSEIKVCPACGIAHHQKCWNEHKGCSASGCTEHHGPANIAESPAPKPQISNEKSRTMTAERKRKIRNRFIMLGILIILALGGFLFLSNYFNWQAEEAYMAIVKEYDETITANVKILDAMAETTKSYWSDFINQKSDSTGTFTTDTAFFSLDHMRDMVKYYHQEDLNVFNPNHDKIKSHNNHSKKLPNDKQKYADISEAVDRLYTAYNAYYDEVLYFDGTYSSFLQNIETVQNDYKKAYDAFKALLS